MLYVSAAHRDVKIRSGDWFLEEKAKRFPLTGVFYCPDE